MTVTFMDILVIMVTVFSGFLAMLRGFSREFFSLASWAGAAIASYFLYGHFLNFFQQYFHKPLFALAASALTVFLIALILLFFITMQLSNLIVQSSLGPIDRLLGLIYGCIRGLLLCAFAVILISTMTKIENRPYWFQNAHTLPALNIIAKEILSLLPHNLGDYLDYADKLQEKHKP